MISMKANIFYQSCSVVYGPGYMSNTILGMAGPRLHHLSVYLHPPKLDDHDVTKVLVYLYGIGYMVFPSRDHDTSILDQVIASG